MASKSRGLRRQALQKIAALAVAATSTTHAADNADLDRLFQACSLHSRPEKKSNGDSKETSENQIQNLQPMNIREFEVLLALCKAAPSLSDLKYVEKLISLLLPYMVEAHRQNFVSSPFFRDIEPSPIESFSFHLTTALLSLGAKKYILQEKVKNDIWVYLNRCQIISSCPASPRLRNATEVQEAIDIATVTLSLLGFLDAATTYANLWNPADRLSLIKLCRVMFSEDTLVTIETAFSTIRNTHLTDRHVKEWKQYLQHYVIIGRPLGAMLIQKSFMWLLVATSSLLSADDEVLKGADFLDLRIHRSKSIPRLQTKNFGPIENETIEILADIAAEEMSVLEDGADYLRLGSISQQKLAFSVKAGALVSYLNCVILNENSTDAETLTSWLESTLADPIQMADKTLSNVVLRSVVLVSKFTPEFAPTVSRILPRFIVQGRTSGQIISAASSCLANILQLLSPDAVITTIYLLGNVLSSGAINDKTISTNLTAELGLDKNVHPQLDGDKKSSGSTISLATIKEEDTIIIRGNIVEAICTIAASCNDTKITALAQSMLSQRFDKISRSIDARIITETSGLALSGSSLEFRSLLKLYAKITTEGILQKNDALLMAVVKGRNRLSLSLRKDSPLFEIYLRHLLEAIIRQGDVHLFENTRKADIKFAAQEIAQLLQPLAILMSTNDLASDETVDEEIWSLVRDSWFNIVVHGFSTNTDRGHKYIKELCLMAKHSKPLVTEQRGEQVESDIELNTVLRRGGSSEYEAKQKRRLSSLLPSRVSEIRALSYRKVIFLHSAYLVETLRAETGDCTKALTYFLEPSMRKGDMSITMEAVTSTVMSKYLSKTLRGTNFMFSAQHVAKQLALIFCHCCYRIDRVQQAAVTCAHRIIHDIPSALCQKYSLFALLELLTLMWTSCLEAETDEYEWKSSFSSVRGNVNVELSDDFEMRRRTLNNLYRKAKAWVTSVINIAPLDVKGLLQTYLSEYDDDGAYSHVSLGRSFALEMGSLIPSNDQRLEAIDRHVDCNINTASEFIAQYTTRQEYRQSNLISLQDTQWLHLPSCSSVTSEKNLNPEDSVRILARLETQLREHKIPPLREVRDILRRAASLLYQTNKDECAIVHYLVSIPFVLLTNNSIKIGVSLWLGVLNENPRMESRLLIEIAQQWELTIHQRRGVFRSDFIHPDPFNVKQEFAPSDRAILSKKIQRAHNLLSPHMKIIQFLGSHFNATRLGSINVEKVFIRVLEITLERLKQATAHPLAREVRFQIVLLGLNILRNSIGLDDLSRLNFKDLILSAALDWFSHPPCWSYGGNRLQLKAEDILLVNVSDALLMIEKSGENLPASKLKKIQQKESLLQVLIESERQRIGVWLHPFAGPHDVRTSVISNKGFTEKSSLLSLVETAWTESAALAIQLFKRFPSAKVNKDIRNLLLSYPEKAISSPEAVHFLLGDFMPDDISTQHKYLLYWACVSPINAITYFLPVYRNDPFILQYAVRALESHPVDVTFFYVPQIVQTLRYDDLGYVERYIVETAKYSQLFAHQIIWNMKANAFKDEESQIPDDVKSTLDKVMVRMIAEFSVVDKVFYEKEFAFFDEVTSISGKLKPYVKRPKPEKKQKIEEELRKIKVEVGVYLPSNPEGIVIGIDRKSGRPLQSHAKAPYMATFRIQRTVNGMDEADILPGDSGECDQMPQKSTIEIWQSAIFKVGDDCRQDVLALQMIAAFRGIFNNVGLDVYVFPYRVIATAPGCGVIDVLPNSISRDMLGREAVNGLYDYFVSKYGNEDSLRFQEARGNFVKSMAAYSIISYLLQFKDRHNGNIMIDDAGHILHIDFGFCFDIAPGGVKFERAPFKLTSEMIAVMGGSIDHQIFKWFEELCIKAFLASRQYMEPLSQLVLLMLDSGLPCFKPETIKNFKDRFVLDKTERDAADYMKGLIKASYKSYSTSVYDQFQLLTNGIPF
ncbi:Phosphatidylinositol 4-kinase STT4 [Golovinomyces cichoracearum]|uniref:1-phosphatidylinositol 4-kinase n=1 Tax=Golovinomyces cichoracearum TaxID=62708 RepID=A0A420J5K1_9PEZI|nr:Phosphatidylinositol 4-kinase STT4 [Golovinomyces cichoracearum]